MRNCGTRGSCDDHHYVLLRENHERIEIFPVRVTPGEESGAKDPSPNQRPVEAVIPKIN
jgi:hypothetical protein